MALSSAPASARDLTVVGFGGVLQEAFTKAYFEPFKQKTGTPLIQDSYTGGYARQKAMVESKQVTWDLVQMDEDEMSAACDQGILEPIDSVMLPSSKDVAPNAFAKCGVGAFVWSKVMTYDRKKFGANGPKTWADFWDTKKWPGKRGLRKQPRMTLEIALLADGVKPADIYRVLSSKSGQDRAFKKLNELKPHIVWWEAGAQPLGWLDSGAVALTSAYSGRIADANKKGKNFALIWEGQLYSMDYWTIPQGSTNRQKAYELLDYMLQPDSQVAFAKAIPYGVTNKKATAAMPNELVPLLPTTPQNMKNSLQLHTGFWLDSQEELLQRFTTWVSQK